MNYSLFFTIIQWISQLIHWKIGSNELEMVDHPTYNPIYGNKRRSSVKNEF